MRRSVYKRLRSGKRTEEFLLTAYLTFHSVGLIGGKRQNQKLFDILSTCLQLCQSHHVSAANQVSHFIYLLFYYQY